jgi:hypothetical protein
MVKGQVLGATAVGAGEAIAKEDVETGEGGRAVLSDVGLQGDDRRQAH